MTGYDLYAQAAHLISTIESLEGADPDILDPQLAAWLDSCDDKIAAYHAVLKRFEIEDAALKAEADAIAAARKRHAKQAERVRDLATLLLITMEQLGNEPKVKRSTFSAWLATTESVSAPEDATLLPLAYQRVKVEANKAKLKDALKAGELVDGCSLVQTRGVVIRGAK
jgi:hypothetical protein